MDKMRESFEKWAKAECLDLDSVDGFYSDNDTHIAWGAWQAAQSAAVPEHIRSIKIPTDSMEQEFQKHYRRGYEAGKSDAVPVVGDVEALICDDCGAETNDPWHDSKGTNRHYHRCDPCNSITAAELDALRKGERDREVGAAIQRAAKELPEGCDISIRIENGAATVELYLADADTDASFDMDVDADNRLAAEIHAAVDAAIAGEGRRNENRP